MPVATGTALAIMGGMGAAGALSGALKDKTEYSSGMRLNGASGEELAGQRGMMDAYSQLQGMVGKGPGEQDVSNSLGASRSLADMLKAYSEGGFLPGQSDINTSNDIAGKLFQAQRLGMQQNFGDQLTEANRSAALMGRDPNDPILKTKLAQEQTRQASMLDASQGAFAQNFALSLPGQRLDYAGQRANVLGGLASQAMANRQAIAAMGEGIMNNERNFRLQTAEKYGSQESGGGLKGALSGFLAGAGTGASLATGIGGFNPNGGAGNINSSGGAGNQAYGPPIPAGFQPPMAARAPALSLPLQQYSAPAGPAAPSMGYMGMAQSLPYRSAGAPGASLGPLGMFGPAMSAAGNGIAQGLGGAMGWLAPYGGFGR
jgi:hypothetical protein